jgi:RHS repeat-associated protein
VWWDGDEPLVEERTPDGTGDVSNSGLIGNIHGLTIDEPLAVIGDATRIINYNWRGQGMSSVFTNGEPADVTFGFTTAEVDWPAVSQAETYFAKSADATPSNNAKLWLGTSVANGQGTTGMLYRRNRYFDPKSGQFTQADPIGIAGGMNAFGFAGGDPINFSDPFGLQCPNKNEQSCSLDQQVLANIGAAINRAIATVGSFGNSLASGLKTLSKEAAIQGGIALLTGGEGNLLFSGSRMALRTALKTSWIEGVSGSQGLQILERLGKGAVDDITISAGAGGNITATFTKMLQSGKEVTLRTYNRSGKEISTLRRMYDEAGKLVREGVIR